MSGTNAVDQWIYLDGPEPEHVQTFLDALRDLPPSTPADKARRARRFFDALDAELAQCGEPASAEDAGEAASAEHGGAIGAVSAFGAVSSVGATTREGGALWMAEAGATARSPVAAAGLVDGTSGAPAGEPRPRVEVREDRGGDASPHGPVAKAPENLAGTADAVEIPAEYRKGALPFRDPVPGAPSAPKTMEIRVARVGLGETLDANNEAALAQAVAEAKGAVIPFAGNTVGSGVVPFPRLTLEEYTSLRAELAVRPEATGEIFAKYHVLHDAALAALAAHWDKEMSQRPELRAAFGGLLPRYMEWVRQRER